MCGRLHVHAAGLAEDGLDEVGTERESTDPLTRALNFSRRRTADGAVLVVSGAQAFTFVTVKKTARTWFVSSVLADSI
jgi:hypothetical protein